MKFPYLTGVANMVKGSGTKADLSVFEGIGFEKSPVGVKFFFEKPKDMPRLEKRLGLCEVLKEAHERDHGFYIDRDNEDCVGKVVLGMVDVSPVLEAGQLGPELGIYEQPRANMRIYRHFPKFPRGTVNYVAFARLDCLDFDPDLLVLYATARQAGLVLRAMSYSTGEIWEPKSMPVVACGWLYVYPFMTGKVNYLVTGMSYGMIAREVFPEGKVLVSIPWNWIPTIVENLKRMQWELPTYKREVYFQEMRRLAEKFGLIL